MAKLKETNIFNSILIELEQQGVSDIHLKSGYKIYYRLFGDIKVYEKSEVLNNSTLISYIAEVFTEKIKIDFKNTNQADFGFATSNNTRYRANLFRTSTGYALSLRRINNFIASFEDLHAPEIFKEIATLQKGLVIVSGPTGCGKSTTITSIIDYINSNYCKHIITIEDPIEFIHHNKNCLINQREVGVDAKSFSLAIKAALREDPDIILLGEIRDPETIKECLIAAETGHLVFTTMHTQTAAKSVDRIIETCQPEEKEMVRSMLSTSLQAVILQKLLKRKDGDGRIAAFEILLGTSAIRNLIKENRIAQIDSMLQTGKKFGMVDMNTSIQKLFNDGYISKEEMDANIQKLGKENGDE